MTLSAVKYAFSDEFHTYGLTIAAGGKLIITANYALSLTNQELSINTEQTPGLTIPDEKFTGLGRSPSR